MMKLRTGLAGIALIVPWAMPPAYAGLAASGSLTDTVSTFDLTLSWSELRKTWPASSTALSPVHWGYSVSTSGSQKTVFHKTTTLLGENVSIWSTTPGAPSAASPYSVSLSQSVYNTNTFSGSYTGSVSTDNFQIIINGNLGTFPSTGTIELKGSTQAALPPPRTTIFAIPVPEADTYALMIAGLGMLTFVARRKRTRT